MLILCAVFAAACDDDNGEADPATTAEPAATRTVVPPSPTAAAVESPAPAESPGAGEQEVTAIVGTIVAATNTIEINQLSGAAVTQIEVTPQTQIRRARGGTATLADLRPSDRIVATGTVEGDLMTATRITVQDAVPGSSPG